MGGEIKMGKTFQKIRETQCPSLMDLLLNKPSILVLSLKGFLFPKLTSEIT